MKVMTIRNLLPIMVLASTLLAEEPQKKSGFKRMFSGPELPAELTSDVDIFRNRMVSRGNPFTLSPYKVTDLKSNRLQAEGERAGVYVPGIASVGAATTSSESAFSFTMNQADQPRWNCRCDWSGSRESVGYLGDTVEIDRTLKSQTSLYCTFVQPQPEGEWLLEQEVSAKAKGLGVDLASEGKLSNGSGSEFTISALSIHESRVLGEINAGYVFKAAGKPVAALVYQGNFPRQVVIHRSVSEEDRSLLMSAAAALHLGLGGR